MNETVTRALSGLVYIVLLVGCILHSELSFLYIVWICNGANMLVDFPNYPAL